jgi:hypothetical protein
MVSRSPLETDNGERDLSSLIGRSLVVEYSIANVKWTEPERWHARGISSLAKIFGDLRLFIL